MQADDARSLLLETIRAKLASGALPRKKPDRLYVGKGTRTRCAVCDIPTSAEENEYEFDGADGRVYVFHERCFVVWDTQRAHR